MLSEFEVKAIVEGTAVHEDMFVNETVSEFIARRFAEQAETHALELRAYEATVQNLEQRIRELEVELSPTITCDDCGSETPDPWHSSKNNNRHHHRCDACHTAALEAQRVPEGWKHICNALCVDGLELWVAACPHCGMPRSAAPAPKEGDSNEA